MLMFVRDCHKSLVHEWLTWTNFNGPWQPRKRLDLSFCLDLTVCLHLRLCHSQWGKERYLFCLSWVPGVSFTLVSLIQDQLCLSEVLIEMTGCISVYWATAFHMFCSICPYIYLRNALFLGAWDPCCKFVNTFNLNEWIFNSIQVHLYSAFHNRFIVSKQLYKKCLFYCYKVFCISQKLL